ncbi:hypothetical protein F240042I4_30680 [Eisenbergiella tayi]
MIYPVQELLHTAICGVDNSQPIQTPPLESRYKYYPKIKKFHIPILPRKTYNEKKTPHIEGGKNAGIFIRTF